MAEHHLSALRDLGDALAGLGLEIELLEPGDGLPVPALVVSRGDPPQHLSVSYVPIDEDALFGVELVQLFGPLGVAATSDTRQEVAVLLARLNATLPAGAFAISDEGQIVLRHLHPVRADEPLEHATIGAVVGLLLDAADSERHTVAAVALGELSAEEAMTSG